MAWDIVSSVWLILLICCFLAALCFLRALALECQRQVEAYDTQRQAAQARVDYELRRREQATEKP